MYDSKIEKVIASFNQPEIKIAVKILVVILIIGAMGMVVNFVLGLCDAKSVQAEREIQNRVIGFIESMTLEG